jgi:hypothetical protein
MKLLVASIGADKVHQIVDLLGSLQQSPRRITPRDEDGHAMRTPKCPKCSQPMDEGFIGDSISGNRNPAEWVEGPPQTSFWARLKSGTGRKVATYCCAKCGFLESYAETE